IVLVSAGAYLILMVLIQRDSMAATSSLMFLVPPVTAVIAAIGFNEPLTLFSLTGFAVTSAGVYLVTRYKSA
ncbi:MAG TPA: EamA family transporter, partial [Alphaproteobacteria bacterium]|nr:EamA family transporter [Alphaproteobacteria bacterium]HCA13423.1 EamA family transporter [Alphaproteobacteria bacterium]HCD80249.1 EamA family transporter [Alphaproteobacteria bacterium]HCM07548.1 EamA family transporter [Alphaproteobacteria bacterium]